MGVVEGEGLSVYNSQTLTTNRRKSVAKVQVGKTPKKAPPSAVESAAAAAKKALRAAETAMTAFARAVWDAGHYGVMKDQTQAGYEFIPALIEAGLATGLRITKPEAKTLYTRLTYPMSPK